MDVFTVKRGDRLPALVQFARDEIGPMDLAGFTAVFRAVNVLTGLEKINEPATIATDPTFTAAANVLTSNGHDIVEGQDVTLKTTGVLYAGLSVSKTYYAVNVTANTLQLSLMPGGPAITIGGGASGVHTLIVGKVTYDWSIEDTDTPGTYQAQIDLTKDSRRLSVPNDSHVTIEVISDLSDNSERTIAIIAVMDRVQPQTAPKLRQAQVELEVDRALLAVEWTPLTEYGPGGVEVVPPVRNGYAYQATGAGTSGAVFNQSDWSLGIYDTFSDGHSGTMLEWENVGSARYNAGILGAEFNRYDIRRAARACWQLKARQAAQMIDSGNLSYSQLHENCINHACAFTPFQRATRLEWIG